MNFWSSPSRQRGSVAATGPGGVSVDTRSPQERALDREMRRDRYERQREREWRRARSRDENCRTITTQRETPRGVISRTERVCD